MSDTDLHKIDLPSDPEAMVTLAKTTEDPDVLDALVEQVNGAVREAVVGNPACSAKTLTRIAQKQVPGLPDSPVHWDERILSRVMMHRNTPWSVRIAVKDYVREAFAPPSLWGHDFALSTAEHPRSTERMLRICARQPYTDVRLACAQNPSTAVGDLYMLARDESTAVREAVEQRPDWADGRHIG